jgi:hypothetical protein
MRWRCDGLVRRVRVSERREVGREMRVAGWSGRESVVRILCSVEEPCTILVPLKADMFRKWEL